MDIDAIAGQAQDHRVIDRIDIVAMVWEVIAAIDLPAIIRDSTGSMASESVRSARLTGIAADYAISLGIERHLFLRRRRTGRPGPSVNQAGASLVPAEALQNQGRSAGIVTRLVANTIDALLVWAALIGTYLGVVAFRFVVVLRDFTWQEPSWVRFVLGLLSRTPGNCSMAVGGSQRRIAWAAGVWSIWSTLPCMLDLFDGTGIWPSGTFVVVPTRSAFRSSTLRDRLARGAGRCRPGWSRPRS